MTHSDTPSGTALWLLRVAVAVVSLEALTFIVLAALDLADLSSDRLGFGIGTALFLLAYGGGQLVAGWRILRGDVWARGPLVFTQLIQLGLAWNLRDADDAPWLSPLLAVAAVAVLACLVNPPVNRALVDDPTA